MPTLIRLLILLLVLAGLVFGAMVALAIFIDPGEREMRVRIPARDLGIEQPTNDPLGIRPPPALPIDPGPTPPPPAAAPAAPAGGGAQTVELPPE